MNDDICPHCNVDLRGEDIVECFTKQYHGDREAAENAASVYYNWLPEHGPIYFSRKIGLYDRGRDATVAWKCPDCNKEWSRNEDD